MRYLERDLQPGEEVIHVSMKDYAVWVPTIWCLLALVMFSGVGQLDPPGDGSSHLRLPIVGGALFIPYLLALVCWWRRSGTLVTNQRILQVDLTLHGIVQGAIPLGLVREARVNRVRGWEWVGVRLRDGTILTLLWISRPQRFVDAVNDQVERLPGPTPGEISSPQGVYYGISNLVILAHGGYVVILGVMIKTWGAL